MTARRHLSPVPPRRRARIRANHRLLRLVLDTLPVGVIVVNRDGDVMLANPMAGRVWGGLIVGGRERREKSKGFRRATGERIGPDEWGSVRALEQGVTSLDELIDIETFDGERKTIQNSAAPILGDDGTIVGAVIVNQDVTERERAEMERARRARQQDSVAQLSLTALRGGEIDSIFDQTVALVARTLDVEHAMIMEARPASGSLVFRTGVGPWREEIIGRVTVPMAPGFMSWFSLRSRAPVIVEDLKRETRFAPCELLIQHGVKSGINVPIAGREQPFGVLGAHTTRSRSFTDDEAQFLWAMGHVLACSIEHQRSAGELREKREKLQALSRQLIAAQESERRSIARELHDDFGQILTALKLHLTMAGRDESESIAMVDGALERMRDLAHDLRPPMLDELGLVPSLRWYLERESRRAGIALELVFEEADMAVPPSIATTCFRVAQEAFTNVIRHAEARHVFVSLGVEQGALQLVMRDDGRGFDVAEADRRAHGGESQGLLNMQERAALAGGDLTIDSIPGGGTTLRARFPLGSAG